MKWVVVALQIILAVAWLAGYISSWVWAFMPILLYVGIWTLLFAMFGKAVHNMLMRKKITKVLW